jgi:hypothetical protein
VAETESGFVIQDDGAVFDFEFGHDDGAADAEEEVCFGIRFCFFLLTKKIRAKKIEEKEEEARCSECRFVKEEKEGRRGG